MKKRKIVIVGAGAAGFFAAITAAETAPEAEVVLLEATTHPLAKVRVSGGGRCNVTHALFEPRELVKRYPRGGRELLGAFHRFQPRDTIAWFEARGVTLKTEGDGRMFPVTDRSETIAECLLGAARTAGVALRERCGLVSAMHGPGARAEDGGFQLELTQGERLDCDALLLSTGGNRSSAGFSVARHFGHVIEPLAPSLFTFDVADPRLAGLAGIAVADTVASVAGTRLRERGPTLVTHRGLSGPAILRLSAWGARELQERDYRCEVTLNWVGGAGLEPTRAELAQQRQVHPKRKVLGSPLFGIPQRLWERLAAAAGIGADTLWTTLSNQLQAALAEQLTAGVFKVAGKSTNKEEFVTCGGVRLAEVDFRTMQSRLCPGLFFAGEILDIDGITGGFNFQSAWTTGYLAGTAMGKG
jgi:predicted Rossmann fold flavoprotein